MTLNISNPETRFMIDAVRAASNLVVTVQREMVTAALEKDDKSPVTIADFAAQALVSKMLMDTFPDDALVGEEESGALRADPANWEAVTQFVTRVVPEATPEKVAGWIDRGGATAQGRYWTLDPIDGTKGFLRGMQYAVALALIEDGDVKSGALGCPNLEDGWREVIGGKGSLLAAARSEGTWVSPLNDAENFTQVHVSDINDPAAARYLRSYETGHTNVDQLDVIAEAMGVKAEPVRMDSQAKYAILACGKGDAIFRLISAKQPDYKEKIWDQAAGMVIAQEAGGRVTDLDGKALDFRQGRMLTENRGVLVTNGYLHDASLAAIRAAKA